MAPALVGGCKPIARQSIVRAGRAQARCGSACARTCRSCARIRCAGRGHDLLLAFSCKTRYFCPSCHQKRVLAWGDWVEQFVLRPVAHRQYVFTVPKLIRPFFAYRVASPRGCPRFILFVQTFGDLVNFNPTYMRWSPTACSRLRVASCRCRRSRSRSWPSGCTRP